MKIKSLVDTQKSRFTSNFRKSSLLETKQNVAGAINTQERQQNIDSAIAGKDKRIASLRDAHVNSYTKEALMKAGARKGSAESLADLIKIASRNGGQRIDIKHLKLADFDLSTPRAASIFNKLIDSTLAGPGLRKELHSASSNHYDTLIRKMEAATDERAAQKAGKGYLQYLLSVTAGADSAKADAIGLLGTLLTRQVKFARDASGNLVRDSKGQLQAILFEQTRDEMLLKQPSGGANWASRLATHGADRIEQKVATTKLSLGMTVDKAGKNLLEAKRVVLKSSSDIAGVLAAASRPVAAVAATPVMVGVATAAAGVSAATAGAVAGVAVGVVGVAAAASPVWAVATVLADGIGGGSGIASRSKGIASGSDVRKNLGLPSKETMSKLKGLSSVFAKRK